MPKSVIDVAAAEKHILRLHVAVHEPLRMREGECAADLDTQLERVPTGSRLCSDELLQVLAVDVLEHDVLPPVRPPRSITVTMFGCEMPPPAPRA
jgi:hypothetical protein